jgi:hypothetical protein
MDDEESDAVGGKLGRPLKLKRRKLTGTALENPTLRKKQYLHLQGTETPAHILPES